MRLAALLTAAILLAGCDADEANTTPDAPSIKLVFPTQPEPAGFAEEAGLQGLLTRRSDCLYVTGETGSRVLPIWPYGFSYETENGDVFVVDEEGHRLGRVGYRIEMGGGFHGASRMDYLREVAEGCRGPYFVVGNVIEPDG